MVGRVNFLRRVQQELNDRTLTAIGIRGHLAIGKHGNPDLAQIFYGGRRTLVALYALLYQGGTRYLQRKHEIFYLLTH